MLLRAIILTTIIATSQLMQAQHASFIGKTKAQVKEIMQADYRVFGQDNSITRQQFNYLKYVNGSQTITWIIYFTDEDICRSTKKVCDYVEYDFVLKELDEQYEQTGAMQWEYMSGGEPVQVTLKEEDWYFTVREQRGQ